MPNFATASDVIRIYMGDLLYPDPHAIFKSNFR